jgi:Zn-dependent M28 family amino/carboxypeptidase
VKFAIPILGISLVLLVAACGKPAADTDVYSAAALQAAATITADGLRQYTAEVSRDEFEGRGPGSDGDRLARKYLAEQMAALGFQAGGADGSWEQAFELVGLTATQPVNWQFESGEQSISFQTSVEFMAFSGIQEETAALEDAEIVFVGYGIQAPEYDWDDYKDYDLKGKVLLILNNDPDWDEQLFAGKTRLYYGRYRYKYETAAANGAAGAIIMHTRASAGYPWQVVQTSWAGEQFELPAGDEARLKVKAWLTEAATRTLVKFAGQDLDALLTAARSRDFEPVSLGITTSIAMPVAQRRVETANVLGLLPGGDPLLADEVVVYSAHHDHLGIGKADPQGDVIYNGARDNGTGVAQLLEIGKAMVALPERPRRSILLAFVGAEEQGLLGSQYYAQNPTFAPGKIAVNINLDGGNIWGKTSDITFVGFGKSSADQVVSDVAARQGRVVKPDQYPDRGYFYRSDQFNFAKIGVPAIYLKPGVDFLADFGDAEVTPVEHYENVQYHQPSDEISDAWDFAGMVDDTLVGFWAGLQIANANNQPAWYPGDEFEAARLESLRELR